VRALSVIALTAALLVTVSVVAATPASADRVYVTAGGGYYPGSYYYPAGSYYYPAPRYYYAPRTYYYPTYPTYYPSYHYRPAWRPRPHFGFSLGF
jgi:hypothetical protein